MFNCFGRGKVADIVDPNISEYIDNIYNDNPELRLDAASRLNACSINDKKFIAQAKGIPGLVRLLKDENPETIHQAILALTNLAKNDIENQSLIAESGAIASLVQLLRNGNVNLRSASTFCLAILAKDNELNRGSMATQEVMTLLIKLLQDKNTNIKANAVLLARNLAVHNPSKILIAAVGGMQILINFLDDEAINVKINSAFALGNLAINTANRTEFSRTDVVLRCVNFLQDKNADVREAGATLLARLTLDNEANQAAVAKTTGVLLLVRLLKDRNAKVRGAAAWVLWEVALNDQASNTIYRNNGSKQLVQLLKDADPFVRRYAAGALQNLMAHKSDRKLHVEQVTLANGVERLIYLLNDANVNVRRSAVGALSNTIVSSAHGNRKKIISTSVLRRLIQLLGDDDAKVCAGAIWTLKNLILEGEEYCKKIVAAGAIVPLVKLLSHDNEEVRCSAAAALYKEYSHELTTVRGVTEKIIAAGGIPPFVRLLEDSKPETRGYACRAMWTFAIYEPAGVIAANGIPALLKLLRGDEKLYSDVFTSLKYLIEKIPACKSIIVQLGGIDSLCSLVRQAKGRTSSVELLWMLAKDNPAYQELIADMDIFDRLEKIAKEASSEEKRFPQELIVMCKPVAERLRNERAKQARLAKERQAKIAHEETIKKIQTISDSAATGLPSSVSAISPAELVLQNELSRGSFNVINKALWNDVPVVTKRLINGSNLPRNETAILQKQMNAFANLRHVNIVSLYGVCLEAMNCTLVMEYMAQGSLSEVLYSRQGLPWLRRAQLALQIATGLLFLHEHNVVHCDLKSNNILLDSQARAKISNFGLFKLTSDANPTVVMMNNSLAWAAPELLGINSEGYCEETDVYAFAMLLWEIASRKVPYEKAGNNQALIISWIKGAEREKIPAETPGSVKQVIEECWRQRAEDRPTMKNVVSALRNST